MSGYFHYCLLLFVVLFVETESHGILWDPPSRSSMWRFGFNTPVNYNDMELFCGGMTHQWTHLKGKCGLCGDPYDGVRENEAGGKYATGTISRYYRKGQVILVDINLTANHLGWFEFRLCPNNDVTKAITQKCLNKYPLQLADDSGSRLHIGSRKGHYIIKLKLPAGLTCTQCVFQWKYHTGNTWGKNKVTHCTGMGCSDAQEEFYGCSDVGIVDDGVPLPTARPNARQKHRSTRRQNKRTTPRHNRRTTLRRRTPPRRHTTKRPVIANRCRAIGIWQGISDQWCRTNCPIGNCPTNICKCN